MAGHDVSIEGDVVRKRYLRTDRGEPGREWAALVLLHEHAPGLAPRPLARESDPPVVVMSRVPGAPVERALTTVQGAALVTAYRALFAVPLPAGAEPRHWHPAAFLAHTMDRLKQERVRTDVPPVVRRALATAREWHARRPAGLDRILDPVLAQGDGRVDNVLWDGERMRLVDFEASGEGDLAFEVADLVEHVSARLGGLRDVDAVLAGFGLGAEQADRVASYRVVLASFWLLVLLPDGAGRDLNPVGSLEHQAEHLLTLVGDTGPVSAPVTGGGVV